MEFFAFSATLSVRISQCLHKEYENKHKATVALARERLGTAMAQHCKNTISCTLRDFSSFNLS
jgi:hypothetical protein